MIDEELSKALEEINATGEYDFKNGSKIVFKDKWFAAGYEKAKARIAELEECLAQCNCKRAPKGFVARFWSKVNKGAPKGCWEWTSCLVARSGYGVLSVQNRPKLAHRIAWELTNGPIAPQMHLDHACSNRRCVNPAHLSQVTPRENILRGNGSSAINARKTHCLQGHPFNNENTAIKSNGQRACRICTAKWRKESNQRRAEKKRRAGSGDRARQCLKTEGEG